VSNGTMIISESADNKNRSWKIDGIL
jgi:hypothetical protein